MSVWKQFDDEVEIFNGDCQIKYNGNVWDLDDNDDVIVTEKPLYLELCWHLKGEAWWSQTNFDCTIWGGWGSPVGSLESLMKLEPSLCTNG